ncbi:MAG: hypothetical protein OXC80_07500 [Gammaproteobacteria bacterium]|nr:hypothetical protein [Gammaproteobacteria bacterium]
MVWDPNPQLQAFAFERQVQTFPDLGLRSDRNGETPLLNIELQGWYLFSHEQVQSYRFAVSKHTCNTPDMLVVVL